jgi:hypothetical protein
LPSLWELNAGKERTQWELPGLLAISGLSRHQAGGPAISWALWLAVAEANAGLFDAFGDAKVDS